MPKVTASSSGSQATQKARRESSLLDDQPDLGLEQLFWITELAHSAEQVQDENNDDDGSDDA